MFRNLKALLLIVAEVVLGEMPWLWDTWKTPSPPPSGGFLSTETLDIVTLPVNSLSTVHLWQKFEMRRVHCVEVPEENVWTTTYWPLWAMTGEETLFVKGVFHITDGILIQRVTEELEISTFVFYRVEGLLWSSCNTSHTHTHADKETITTDFTSSRALTLGKVQWLPWAQWVLETPSLCHHFSLHRKGSNYREMDPSPPPSPSSNEIQMHGVYQ